MKLLVSSPGAYGTDVLYIGNVVGKSNSIVAINNVLVIVGLSYTQTHTVRVSANSSRATCLGLKRSTFLNASFSTAGL